MYGPPMFKGEKKPVGEVNSIELGTLDAPLHVWNLTFRASNFNTSILYPLDASSVPRSQPLYCPLHRSRKRFARSGSVLFPMMVASPMSCIARLDDAPVLERSSFSSFAKALHVQ